ncbi:MAG: hypothetical protein JSU96_01020 [Acidobacteriota bacterium]|nr:MAG: hypothetical protein JSU96_01020 [Acidobacteriota bacterium]
MATYTLSPEGNALDSIRQMERALREDGASIGGLKAGLFWGWHAVGLLFYSRIFPRRKDFDPWVQDYFKTWSDEPNASQALVEGGSQLSLMQILDLLSEAELPSLQPEFYQGWRDRTARCVELRNKVASITGVTVSAAQREELLFLAAVDHHLVASPVDTVLDLDRIRGSLVKLIDLLELLISASWKSADALKSSLSACREAL